MLLAYFYHPELVQKITIVPIIWAVATTCLIASSNYVLNEILDAPTDRNHPVKRHRPVPSGHVSVPSAYAEWGILGAAGLTMASVLAWPFFLSGLCLLIMGLIYNVPPVRAKELPYLDVLSESINNPIRLLLGWFAVIHAELPPLSLLISYWMLGAFFMAAKRFAEFRFIGHAATACAYRPSFRFYDEKKLLISMFFYTTCFAFFLGVFIVRWHLELILFVPFIAGFVSYYLYVAFKHESAAQSPERLYREKGLIAYLLICLAVFVVLMFVHIPMVYQLFNVPPSQVPALWKF
jgi:4-hydroxybenzoate polyprenyltransferase